MDNQQKLRSEVEELLVNIKEETTKDYIIDLIMDDDCPTEFTGLSDQIGPFLQEYLPNTDEVDDLITKISNLLGAHNGISYKPKPKQPIENKSLQQKEEVAQENVSKTYDSASESSDEEATVVHHDEIPHVEDVDDEEDIMAICRQRGKGDPLGEGNDINIAGLTLNAYNNTLLENASLRLIRGHRYGLIGKNGIGKTTLFRKIAKQQIAELPKRLTALHVRQEIMGTDKSALESVLACDVERDRLLKEEAELLASSKDTKSQEDKDKEAKRLVDIYDRLAEIDSDNAVSRATSILSGLSFTQKMIDSPTRELSGGWRMRVALACALFLQPDILLLDEPTNHLDLEAILWLQDYLSCYDGTIVIVSHDREFLNAVVTDIIHFHQKQLIYYANCDYDSFKKVREDKLQHKQRLQEQLDTKREKMLQSIQKMTQTALSNKKDHKRLQQVAQKRKKYEIVGLEKTEDGKKWISQEQGIAYRPGSIIANGGGWKDGKMTAGSIVERAEKAFTFKFPEVQPLAVSGPVLQLKDVAFKYEGSKYDLFTGINLTVTPQSRIAILGPNAAGKSTLLGLIRGTIQPTKGEIFIHHNLKIGYFTQHHVDQLDMKLSPLEYMMKLFPLAKEQDMRAHLGAFGLKGKLALQKIGTLSGGQRSRVVFAQISYQAPQMLILDEPTNHLDFEAIDALTNSLHQYAGAVILVSHNQSLIAEIAEELWLISKRKLVQFKGDFEEYRNQIANK